jgi:hypothetical protein
MQGTLCHLLNLFQKHNGSARCLSSISCCLPLCSIPPLSPCPSISELTRRVASRPATLSFLYLPTLTLPCSQLVSTTRPLNIDTWWLPFPQKLTTQSNFLSSPLPTAFAPRPPSVITPPHTNTYPSSLSLFFTRELLLFTRVLLLLSPSSPALLSVLTLPFLCFLIK